MPALVSTVNVGDEKDVRCMPLVAQRVLSCFSGALFVAGPGGAWTLAEEEAHI